MKRQRLFTIVEVTILLLGATPVLAVTMNTQSSIPFQEGGQIIYVDDDNVAGPWYGTLEYPFRYINMGVQYAFSGDTVFVFNGTYDEGGITIYNRINLIGEDRNTTIIDISQPICIQTATDGVNISGFTIKNFEIGIDLNSDNNTIRDMRISHCRFGIRGLGGATIRNTIDSNIIENCTEVGLVLWWSCNDNNITRNLFRNQPEGIRLVASQHSNFIAANRFENNSVAINLWDAIQEEIFDGNVFSHNGCAISLGNAIKITISHSIFTKNHQGITLTSGPNTIFENTFLSNNLDATFTCYGLLPRNRWNHNYWDRPRIAPKLIMGTLLVPTMYGYLEYRWWNVDWHPAVTPFLSSFEGIYSSSLETRN